MSARKVGRVWVDEGPAIPRPQRTGGSVPVAPVGKMVPYKGRGVGDLREHTGRRAFSIKPHRPVAKADMSCVYCGRSVYHRTRLGEWILAHGVGPWRQPGC